jgi:cytochrome b pre-mRNA-processing protein 3
VGAPKAAARAAREEERMMFQRWFARKAPDDSSEEAYRRIVAQARRPEFYAGGGVPDSLDGRFEMLVLHLFLVLHRLQRERGDPACAALAQALADRVTADFDANLREMGAGDLGVGRKVKRMAGALYGRIAAYEAGIDGGEALLRQALRRNLFGTVEADEDQVAAMARYVLAGYELLGGCAAAQMVRGAVDFPLPEPAGPAGKR